MSKNKNLHDVIECEDGTLSVGNYIEIVPTGERDASGHKLYSATCKTCKTVIIKNMSDLRRMSLKCTHTSKNTIAKKRSLVYGVGVNDMPVGWIKNNDLNCRIYDAWRHMLLRGTEQYWNKYPTYTGTTVCKEWTYLSKFEQDIQLLEGYDLWKNNPKQGIMLDKDIKMPGNKHYSKETCCFISHADSNRDVHNRHPEAILKAKISATKTIEKHKIPVRAINLTTNIFLMYSSQREASRKLQIPSSSIWMILNDTPKYASIKIAKDPYGNKWTFEKI